MAVGKKITDLTASGSLKDTDLAIVHDGNGTKRSTLTQLGEYLGTKFSNPNLLINPDFKINQRGKTSYEVSGFDYTVDRWRISASNVSVSDNGLTVQSTGSDGSWMTQKFEKALDGIYTLSIKVSSISGSIYLSSPENKVSITSPGVYSVTLSNITEFNMFLNPNTSVTIEWTKLEKGSIATPFVAPNPADEKKRCQYFTYRASIDGKLANLYRNTLQIVIDGLAMRISPSGSVFYNGESNKVNIYGKGTVTPSRISPVRGQNNMVVELGIESSEQKIVCLYGSNIIMLDAEIY